MSFICWCLCLFILISFAAPQVNGGDAADSIPLTAKDYALRYWKKQIGNTLPEPEFLMEKASPLTAAQYAYFSKIAGDPNELSKELPEFCAQANLSCFQGQYLSLDGDPTFSDYNSNYDGDYSPFDHGNGEFKKSMPMHVEPGLFFREAMLKPGIPITMPDFKDKMPKTSFLPRDIVSRLPFSSSEKSDINKFFHASDNSTVSKIATHALRECERVPNRDETKKCVASIEDMIDFATSILGRDIIVRTMDTATGSKGEVLLGQVKKINDGKVTESTSCHHLLYPYLLYYCHSIPNVRLYEADILDSKTKSKINHGVAICHLDTSSWSPNHIAFVALGSGPGKIEVCHWIFEGHMIWAMAN